MSIAARVVVILIGAYRRVISPAFPRRCRFEPTCSAYTMEAVREHGAARGLYLGLRRIVRCHPLNPGGVDPVPRRSV
jgi:putative membrane protein insertion efficiency factor